MWTELFLVIGTILITYSLTLTSFKCPPKQIIYRYVPQNIFEETPVDITELYRDMFEHQEPWIDSGIN